jgi:glycosyltransferase involved in cell wall biosynthesis
LKQMPDFVPEGIAKTIEQKAKIYPLGLNEDVFKVQREKNRVGPPTVLWNHRWEYDKNPDDFFEMLFDLDRAGVDFRLIVVGEQFRSAPGIFKAAPKLLSDKIIHFGFVPDRQDYISLLAQSDVVVSTADHEFYGLAVLEAIGAGCTPLLPNRLSYPELLPDETHELCLYETIHECRERLGRWCKEGVPPHPKILGHRVANLSWSKLIEKFEMGFSQL